MDKHTCKLCFRTFANGRALGGHMRSHVVAATAAKLTTAAAAASAHQIKHPSYFSTATSSSSSSRNIIEDDDVDAKGMGMGTAVMVGGPLGYTLRENPKKSFRLVDPEFSSTFPTPAADPAVAASGGGGGGSSSIVVQDRESETESSRPPSSSTTHRRRSKRARKSASLLMMPDPPPPSETEPVSSVSDTTPEEDVAISLMMLSRDIWPPPVAKSESYDYQQQQQLSQEHGHRFFIDEDADEEDEDVYEIGTVTRTKNQPAAAAAAKGRSKYQCGTCKKVFRSYQALGGHRASHKKSNGCVPPPPTPIKTAQFQIHEVECRSEANVERNQHECPVCYRVFSSGQALGGHKRSHVTSSSSAAANATITITSSSIAAAPAPPPAASAVAKFGESLIDLNLPAPTEDDAELSAVSDAEFVMA